MMWFNNPKSIEELKKQYKVLAMKHHPDRGGNTATMQEINSQYDDLFKHLKDIHINAQGETYTKSSTEAPNEFKNIINKLINLSNINIEICGCWLWVTGDTIQHKDILKSLKFRWSKSKKAWYFHTEDYTKTSKKTFSLDEIRSLYGSETITAKPQLKLQII